MFKIDWIEGEVGGGFFLGILLLFFGVWFVCIEFMLGYLIEVLWYSNLLIIVWIIGGDVVFDVRIIEEVDF